MAYIQPNSIIQLFQGINLDNRYMHTIYFSSVNAQDSWFANRVTISFQAQSYTRYTRNQVKVQCDVTSILGCTYMRFLNDRAGDKWFYAFIISAEYINENTALITYEIDVMQTWFIGGGSIRPCMVLREHVNDDTFGINLDEEPIGSDVYDADFINSFDDIFYDTYEGGSKTRSKACVVQTTGKDPSMSEGDWNSQCYKQGLFDGTYYKWHLVNESGGAAAMAGELKSMLGDWSVGEQKEDVIDMFTVPAKLARQETENVFTTFVDSFNRPTSYDNYVPKNNKLYMYPFSYLLCTTHNGQNGIYRWEYFDGSSISFYAYGTVHGGGQLLCYPRAYNGQEDNMDCGIVISDFPKNAFNYDAYQAWIAAGGKVKLENQEELTKMRGAAAKASVIAENINALGSLASRATIAATTANPAAIVGAGASALSTPFTMAANHLNTKAEIQEAQNKIDYAWKDARYQPNYTVGESVPALAMAADFLNYYFYHVHVRDDEAKRLDDFFSCYGYAVNRVKAPNLTGRAYWNFVKTKDAVIAGAMPSSAKEAIGRIFDGGITFWHNGDQIGNYMQSVSSGTINNPIV